VAATTAEVVHGVVVFTDIVGFTAFTAEKGDDEALALLAEQDRVVREVLPDDARVVKELGDGLMLWFPEPTAAIAASVALQTRIGEGGGDGSFPLWLRVGVHWGRQNDRRGDLIGHDVNVAARIVDLAAPREVLVSEATWSRAGRAVQGVEVHEIGPAIMKGIPEPVWLLRAVAA
jgi:adenylate cyclase